MGLRARLLLFSGLGAALAGLLLANAAVLWICHARTQQLLRLPPVLKKAVARCQEDPAQWHAIAHWPLRVDAYDANSREGRGENPRPLDAELWARLSAGEAQPARLGWWLGQGSAALVSLPEGGPCGVLQISTPQRWPKLGRHLLVLVLVVSGAAALNLAGVYFLVLRPLLRRLRATQRAASSVGAPRGYQSANDPSPDDLGDISRALDGAHQRLLSDAELLSQRAQSLEEHLADISHDLKTPLAALQLGLENALQARDADSQRQRVSAALREAVYLAALLENAQLARRFSAELAPLPPALARFDLGMMLDAVSLRAALLGQRDGVEVAGSRPDAPLEVLGDPTQVERALGNVAHNAVAYNHAGGHVALELVREGNEFCLSITDDGPGVAPASLPKLGQRAFRAEETRSRHREGSGLGLAISAEVFRRLGWRLRFLSQEPRGLRVEVRGPLAPR